MKNFYNYLLSQFDKSLLDVCLAISAKRMGIDIEDFDPQEFCRAIDKKGTSEDRAKVENGISHFDNYPQATTETVNMLKKILREL